MISRKFIKVTQVITLAVLTYFIAYKSVVSAQGNAWYFNARNLVEQNITTKLNEAMLSQAKAAITKALSFEPDQPHYLHLFAFISLLEYQYITHHNIKPSANSHTLILDAKVAVESSLTLRASWPSSWILLAQITSIEEGASEKVFNYLKKAKSVGPYEFDVHLAVLHLALSHWDTLSPEFKAFYVDELMQAAKQDFNFYQIFEMAAEINMLPMVCLSLQFGKSFEEVKQKYVYKKHCG